VCPLEVFPYKSIGYRGTPGLVYNADRQAWEREKGRWRVQTAFPRRRVNAIKLR